MTFALFGWAWVLLAFVVGFLDFKDVALTCLIIGNVWFVGGTIVRDLSLADRPRARRIQ